MTVNANTDTIIMARPRHLGEGFSSIVKRTSEDVEVPDELLEVAEIKQGDFLKIVCSK